MNKKGFTLVELLVTITVLGIITGLSVPLIRNINQQRVNKKYSTYLDSVNYAAKLYTDSYSVDLFENSNRGCNYISYNDLKSKKLVKDIDLTGISCETNYTAIRVVKFRDKYYYKAYIGCGEKKNDSVTASTFLPEKLETGGVCDDELESANIYFKAVPDSSADNTKKKVYTKITMESATGVKLSSPEPKIYYGYSYEDDGFNIIGGDSGWAELPFAFDKWPESKQIARITNSKLIYINASRNLSTPNGVTGKLNLVLRVDSLKDLQDLNWKHIDIQPDDNYVIIGPFMVDNAKPLFNDSTIVSSKANYKSRIPRLNFKVTDVGYSENNSDFKYCYSYNTDTCSKPSTATELASASDYHNYNPSANLTKLTEAGVYDGSKHDIYVTIADAASNLETKKFEYTIDQKVVLTLDTDGGSTCASGTYNSIGQLKGQKWGDSVVDETGLNNHAFCKSTKTGYDLKGWYTAKNGGGTQVSETTVANANTTAYAKWQAKTVKVTFDCNGGATTGNQTFTYGVANQRFSYTCTRAGYTLSGWTLNDNGTTRTYEVNNGVSNDWINAHSPSVTVKAKWTPKTITVTFNCNGGTGGGTSTYTYGESGQNFNKTCTRTGYNLAGWKRTAGGTSAEYNPTNAVGGGWIDTFSPSITIYAHWALSSYTCSAGYYLAKSGTGCTICPTANYCKGGTYSFNTSTDQGKTACPTGYGNTASTGKSKDTDCYMAVPANKYVKNAKDSAATNCAAGYEKTAHNVNYGSVSSACTLATYTITYNLNGGTVSTANPTSYNVNTTAFTLRNPTKTGYTFAGWTGTGLSGASTSVTVAKGSTGNRTYTATWTANTYTVTYNGNGNTGGSTANSTCTYGSTFTPRTNGFTKTGHTFNGWSGSTTCSTSNTLTATWKANTYTVSYAANGGSGSMTASSCTYGTSFTPKSNTFTRSHYTFNGWSGSTTCTGNMTMTATWRVNKAIIRYHTGTSSGSQLKYKPSSAWAIKNNYEIWNGSTQDLQTVNYGSSADPINYHNSSYLYIKKTSSSNGTAYSGKEWEKCNGANCARSTYDQSTNYTSEQYCNTTSGDCYCCIKVNWK